jgi:hypothetical protein
VWQHGDPVTAVHPDEGAADAVHQRVAAGDDVDIAVGIVEQRAQGRQHRRWPLPPAR